MKNSIITFSGHSDLKITNELTDKIKQTIINNMQKEKIKRLLILQSYKPQK